MELPEGIAREEGARVAMSASMAYFRMHIPLIEAAYDTGDPTAYGHAVESMIDKLNPLQNMLAFFCATEEDIERIQKEVQEEMRQKMKEMEN